MIRRLLLIRHAKAARPGGVEDHDRPLNDRGRRAAAALGRWLSERGLVPDEVIVSDSRRTRETWDGISGALKAAPTPRLEPRLYEAEPEEMLPVLHGASGRLVALVGHNPGIGDLAYQLLAQPPDHGRFDDYPTGATLLVRFDADDWRAVLPGTGVAEDFVVPREL